jgi:hypothetical protein
MSGTSIDAQLVYEPSRERRARPARTLQQSRQLLEHVITVGTLDDLADLDLDAVWIPTDDPGARAWYEQFGDATPYFQGRDELLQMAVELCRASKAPAARALDARLWFQDWVELPQPALGFRSPAEVCCTRAGLEASKVILRSLQVVASL